MRFFKKLAPKNAVALSNGSAITFSTVDGVVGYYATENAAMAKEFEGFMRANQYGITEIEHDEFASFLQKKRQGLKPNYQREVFGVGLIQKMASESERIAAGSAAAAVSAPLSPALAKPVVPVHDAPVISQPAPADVPTAPVRPDFNPPVGKRARKGKA